MKTLPSTQGDAYPGNSYLCEQIEQLSGPYLLMVSGGSDSVALLHLACTDKLDLFDGLGPRRLDKNLIAVLHVNHCLRAQDADKDQAFVEELCAQLEVPCHCVRLDIPALMKEQQQSNMESFARELRYQEAFSLLEEVCYTSGRSPEGGCILTAHTANDRAETALMRLIEGASLPGITSLKARRGKLVRPLIYKRKNELCAYLEKRGLDWREDLSNQDTSYFRSFVRHKIVPRAEERNPAFIDSFTKSLDILQEENSYLEQRAQEHLERMLREKASGILVLESGMLSHEHPALARRVAHGALKELAPDQRLETQHIHAVLEAAQQRPFSRSLPGDIEVRREFDDLVIRDLRVKRPALECETLRVPGYVELPSYVLGTSQTWRLRARIIEVPPGGSAIALARSLSVPHESLPHLRPLVFDADLAGLSVEALREGSARLYIRPAAQGDALEPLGMSGTKKVSDLLCEARVPLRRRALIPLVECKLADEDGEPSYQLVCIAGIRLNKSFACRKNSSRLVELSFQA